MVTVARTLTPQKIHWYLSHRADSISNAVAKRHYNCQSPESKQFAPPGRCLVLLATQQRKMRRALWITSWPFAKYVKHAWPGAWINTLFRNETFWPSPMLIREAIAITRWFATYEPTWLVEPEPPLGIITFVDSTKVKLKSIYGQCYLDAGFQHVGYTKGGLLAFQLLPENMPDPLMPYNANLNLWEELA